MKLKNVLFGLTGALALGFMLASCGNNAKNDVSTTPTKEVTTTPEESTPEVTKAEVVNYLTFMGDNKARVDIMNDLGVTFTYGDATVESKKEMTYNSASKLAFTGEIGEEKINFILVMDNAEGSDVVFHKGIIPSKFAEFLNKVPLSSAKKIYIAISTGDTPTWTKGLNAKMDTAIGAYLK